jgi:hypothetical protein
VVGIVLGGALVVGAIDGNRVAGALPIGRHQRVERDLLELPALERRVLRGSARASLCLDGLQPVALGRDPGVEVRVRPARIKAADGNRSGGRVGLIDPRLESLAAALPRRRAGRAPRCRWVPGDEVVVGGRGIVLDDRVVLATRRRRA